MEFHTVRNEPRRLVLTAKQWITRMNAIGITSHAGRYGGTYFQEINYKYASVGQLIILVNIEIISRTFGHTSYFLASITSLSKSDFRILPSGAFFQVNNPM